MDDPTRKNYELDDLNLYVFLQGFNARTGAKEYRLWSIKRTVTPRPSDLIYGILGAEKHDDFRFLRFGISPAVPRAGSQLRSIGYCSFTYPKGGIPMDKVRDGTFDWHSEYSHHLMVCEGEVDVIFTHHFAEGMLEGPCVRLPYNMPHGLSGGPALDSRGFVCGVNSAGSNVIFGAGSLISLLYCSLLTRLDLRAASDFDKEQSISVKLSILELIALGKIRTDKSEELLGFSDTVEGEAIHPMIHEDDYEFAFESVKDYAENCPALDSPYREKLKRIIYSVEGENRNEKASDDDRG